MAPGLLGMPPELLEMIGDCSETTGDLWNLHGVCRATENATRRLFAKTCFNTRTIVKPGDVPLDHTFGPTLPQDLAAATLQLNLYCKHDVLHANDSSGSEDEYKSLVLRDTESVVNAARLATHLMQYPNVRFLRIGEDSLADEPHQGLAHTANNGSFYYEWAITKDFSTIMASLRACNIKLEQIWLRPWDRTRTDVGIHDLSILVRMGSQLAELHDLALEFAETVYAEHGGPSISAVISSQLEELAPIVPQLHALTLQGRLAHNFNPFQGYATSSPTFRNLTRLCLIACDCGARDFGAFFSKHATTLQSFCAFQTDFQGSGEDIAAMLRTMAVELHALRELTMSYPCAHRERLRFPGVNNVWAMDAEDDDDWVLVCSREGVKLEGREEVAQGTKLMLSNFEF